MRLHLQPLQHYYVDREDAQSYFVAHLEDKFPFPNETDSPREIQKPFYF